MTKQRQVILEELKKVMTHPTADEIYQMVRERLPRISLGTVYRNLEIMSEAGLIQKLDLAGSQMRFDAETKNHYHIRCRKCGQIENAPGDPIVDIEDLVGDIEDYVIESHRLEFTGLCGKCREAETRSTGLSRTLIEPLDDD
jgi:Fur family ferric uptake transcriptional regulator